MSDYYLKGITTVGNFFNGWMASEC